MTTMKQTKLFQGQDVTTKPTMKKVTTSTVVSPGEKSLEKTANSSAKELTKLPAPDPTHRPKHLPIAYKIDWAKDITLKALESLGSTVKDKYKNGTSLLSRWEEEFPDSFDDEAERFDLYCPLDLFGDDQKYTWEEGAEAIFEHCGRDMENFIFHLEVMWDFDDFKGQPKTERRYSKKFGWIVRRFTCAIAHADPTSLFHIEEEDKKDEYGKQPFRNSYWMTDKWSNPTLMLQTNPLSMMWAGSTFFLGHPWVYRRQKVNVFDKFLNRSQQTKKKLDPNPKEEPFRNPMCEPIWMKEITLRALVDLGNENRKDKCRGNSLLRKWEDECLESFTGIAGADRYDFWIYQEIFDDEERRSWEEAAKFVYKVCGNDMSDFMQQLELAWDFEKTYEKDEETSLHALALRRFSHSLAHMDPASFFNIEEEDDSKATDESVFQNSYWILEMWSNPTFKSRATPLSMMWWACSDFLGHPWAWSDEPLNVFHKYTELRRQKMEVRSSKQARRLKTKTLIQEKRKRSRKREEMSTDEDDDEEGKRSDAPYQPSSPDKSGTRFRSKEIDSRIDQDDVEMKEWESAEDFQDSLEYNQDDGLDTPVTNSDLSPLTSVESPLENGVVDQSRNNGNDINRKHLARTSKNLRFEDDGSKGCPSPEINEFFVPRSKRSQDLGTPQILKLSPKEPPKNRISGRRKGVEARNETSEEIDDDDSESEESNSNDAPGETPKLTPCKELTDDEDEDDSEDEDWVDHYTEEEEDDLDDDRFYDPEENEPQINSPPAVERRRGSRDDEQQDDNNENKGPDPLEGIDTTGGVYRSTELGVFDAMAAERLENEGHKGSENEIKILKVHKPPKESDDMEVDDENQKAISYSTVVAHKPKKKVLSEEQEVKSLIQPKLDGLPVPNWYIPIFAFSFLWNGPAAGMSITKKAIQCFHAILDSLFKTPHKFKVLPLDNEKCKNQKLWITNTERAKQLCSQWYQVKNYFDMDFGNVEWLTSQARTTGNKIVRTRIRFAFDDTVEGALATLSGILEEEGGYVRECPLQIDHIGYSGGLPFLPPMMSPEMVAHALMKEMGFKFPVALIWDWVSAPPSGLRTSKTKGKKNLSVQMWRLLTALIFMPQVGDFMRKLYNPKTPRHLFPWCGISTYFHDWRAASKKWLNVGPHGPVREMATSLIQKAIDFNSVTRSFCTPIPIPGMLKVVKTTRFGEISLLRYLYSIKATPLQLETAESRTAAGEHKDETAKGESTEQSDPETEKFIEVVSKKSKKLTKDEQLRLAAEQMEISEKDEREQRAEMVRQKDASKADPLKLITSIFPESPYGYFVLTCRLKVIPLAANVFEGLAAFIIAHLDEPNPKRAEVIVASWLGKAEVDRMKRMNEVWNKETLRVEQVSQSSSQNPVDENGMDWLEFGCDIMDQVQGFLEIDISSADTKDIDDGATVTGAADEMRAKDDMIEDMVKEISFIEDENETLRRRIAELEAEKAATQAVTTTTPAGSVTQVTSGVKKQVRAPRQPKAQPKSGSTASSKHLRN